MGFLNKIALKTAMKGKSKFDLSQKHITTQDFFRPKVTYIKEMIPNESTTIQMSCFSRLDPLVRPMYGHIQIINRCFFVPFRTIFESWNDFIVGNKHTFVTGTTSNVTKYISSVPTLTISDLAYMFSQYDELATQASTTTYDLAINGLKFNLTTRGKIFFDILTTLGYKLTTGYKNADGVIQTDETNVSALPLLAFCKIYYDWFSSPQYANRDILAPYFKGDRSSLSYTDIYLLLNNSIQLCYDNDYFVSAWDKPQSPNGANLQGFTLNDNSLSGLSTSNKASVTTANSETNNTNYSSTPHLSVSSQADSTHTGVASTQTGSISQYILDTLHKATHYVMRYMASGNRALDRFFAEYGVRLDSAKLDRCEYIGKFDVNFDISDVMQTSPDTDQGTVEVGQYGLGSYSGKGLGFNSDTLHYSTDEFGLLVVISYAVPNPQANLYCDGRPYMLQHKSKLDFFHGDFDSLGTRPIRADELVGNILTETNNSTYSPDSVFGWTPRYSEYKCCSQDVLSGDMLLNTRNTLLDSWYMYRRFNDPTHYYPHDFDFITGKTSDFINIWQYRTSNTDHLYTIYNFKVESYLPAKPLYDLFDFDDEGEKIITQLGGSKVTD